METKHTPTFADLLRQQADNVTILANGNKYPKDMSFIFSVQASTLRRIADAWESHESTKQQQPNRN